MGSVRTDVLKTIWKTLKREGFRKLGTVNWIKETGECHLLINFQGSTFGGEAFLNVGCITKLLPLQYPDSGLGYSNFHIWERFDGEKIQNSLVWDKRNELTPADRELLLIQNLQNTVLPWLYSLSSLASIRDYFRQFTFYPHIVTNPKALGLQKPPKYRVSRPPSHQGQVTILATGSLPKFIPFTISELDDEWRHHRKIEQTFETEEEVSEWLRVRDDESLKCFIHKIGEQSF